MLFETDMRPELCDHSDIENVPPEGAVCNICSRIIFRSDMPENQDKNEAPPEAEDLEEYETSL